MTPSLLQLGRLAPELEAELAATFPVHLLAKETDVPAFLERHGGTFNGVVTSARVGMDAAMIDALPNLKVVASFGVGYDLLDVDALTRRGIVASNTPDVLNDCVADTAFGLVIDAARGMSAADRFLRRGDWLKGGFPLQTQVSRKRLGIVGLGRIGQAIARRSTGFDMEVRYHSRNPVQDVPWQHETSLTALAEWCDFLVVAAAGGASTRHLVSAEVLAALGPKGFLINISRGTVVDETALVTALSEKRLGGAGLDVFEFEPRVPQALLTLDNVVLLPHIASGTFETRKAMGDLVVTNLKRYFEDGQLATPIG